MTLSAGLETGTSLSAAIANFTVSTPAETIPQSARHIMMLSILDWVAVGRAGSDEPVSMIVRDMVLEEGGAEQASVFGLTAKLPSRAAALANGTISHALDYDDTHFLHVGHPSVAILPAALAIAEELGATGAEFLDAALIGVEASCRIGAWLGTQHYNAGFHQTATAGAFGAAMAAARLLGLDEDRARHALGIASTRASGLKSQFGTMGKPFNAGIAASNGVEAALLAAKGFISRPDGLECGQGFGETHSGEDNALEIVLAGLGQSYVFETVQHKFHACCHGLHAGLEALNVARAEHGLSLNDVQSVHLTVNPRWLKVCDNPTPSTGLEAKFSYRLTTAMALGGIDTGALATYTDAICREPELIALRDEVSVAGDPAMTDTSARVVIQKKTGERIEGFHELARPLPADVREQKVLAKATSLIGQPEAESLWSLVAALDGSAEAIDARGLIQGR